MYEPFFGLKELPFNVTPDPRFVYFSRYHSEALAALLYGVENRRGFIQVTGEIGAGKTTLSRALLKRLEGRAHTALVFNPRMSEFEILQSIVEDFGIQPKGKKKKDYFDALNKFLLSELEKGLNAVVILDEAQLLSVKALEQIRLLSNLETPTQKLLQIIFLGQPELREVMNNPGLLQLKQRINIRYHLPALPKEEVENYLMHRLKVAGAEENYFTKEACSLIATMSLGIPRMINLLADRALLAAYTMTTKRVDAHIVESAQLDLEGVPA